MPLYMDFHKHVEGLTAQALIDAHRRDVKVQAEHQVEYQRYWYNEEEGMVICLVKAPSKEAAIAVHLQAHGLVADEIIEIQEGS